MLCSFNLVRWEKPKTPEIRSIDSNVKYGTNIISFFLKSIKTVIRISKLRIISELLVLERARDIPIVLNSKFKSSRVESPQYKGQG